MKIKIELEAEDALELCALHHAVMEKAATAIGEFPFEYSQAANITKQFFDEVLRVIPAEEVNRIVNPKD